MYRIIHNCIPRTYLKTDVNQIVVLYCIIITHKVKNGLILIYCKTKGQALRESAERKKV